MRRLLSSPIMVVLQIALQPFRHETFRCKFLRGETFLEGEGGAREGAGQGWSPGWGAVELRPPLQIEHKCVRPRPALASARRSLRPRWPSIAWTQAHVCAHHLLPQNVPLNDWMQCLRALLAPVESTVSLVVPFVILQLDLFLLPTPSKIEQRLDMLVLEVRTHM